MTWPNVIGLIRTAIADPQMRLEARTHLAAMLTDGDLLTPTWAGRKGIFPSDYGSCPLQIWAREHGKEDPLAKREAVDDQLSRLDLGSMIGAWEACLLKIAAERVGWTVTLEAEPGRGHIDALMSGVDGRETEYRVVVEFKSYYDTAAKRKVDTYHALQASDYAEQTNADLVVVVYIGPSVQKGDRLLQTAFDPRPNYEAVAAERERLAPALEDEAPPGIPVQPWSCFTCAFTDCTRNRRKPNMAAVAEEIFA